MHELAARHVIETRGCRQHAVWLGGPAMIDPRVALSTAMCLAALILGGCGDGAKTADVPQSESSSTIARVDESPLDPPAELIPKSAPPKSLANESATAPAAPAPTPRPMYANCTDAKVSPSYEEQRLANVLPAGGTPLAGQILAASGFDRFGPQFSRQLCEDGAITSFKDAVATVKIAGEALWTAALDRVQGREVEGSLPRSDDRMLYWARLQMTLALRQWVPQFSLSLHERAQLQWVLEKASRGQYAIQFPAGSKIKRIIVSGFDPFTLGTPGVTHPSTNVRIGNPSGAIALALNNRQIALPDGTTAVIQTYLLPVKYDSFRKGMQEHTLAPFFTGPDRVLASLTLSQGGDGVFWIENWHGRYHGAQSADNLNTTIGNPLSFPLLASDQDADVYLADDLLGYDPQPWRFDQPAQWTTTTLPIARIIAADTGRNVINPQTSQAGGYRVTWHTKHVDFPVCGVAWLAVTFNESDSLPYPPFLPPIPPASSSCAKEGGGGNYLSNESGYRNTLLRDTLNPDRSILAGHLHVPVMNYFSDGDDARITDAMFESYRETIVAQAGNIVQEVAMALP
jgi:hypothetical protein